MLEIVLSHLSSATDKQAKIHILRELLQTIVLYRLSNSPHAADLIFGGGTALRFFYDLPRYSEDLDFEYDAIRNPQISLGTLMQPIARFFSDQGITTEHTGHEKTTVYKGYFKFPGLLHQLGLSTDPKRTFTIKLEIDTHPPALTSTETFTISKYNFTFPLRKRDLPGMMAGKLAALIKRPYTKGRDYYDTMWYMLHRVTPDMELLEEMTGISTLDGLLERMDTIFDRYDPSVIIQDVGPFLQRQAEIENLKQLKDIQKQYRQTITLGI